MTPSTTQSPPRAGSLTLRGTSFALNSLVLAVQPFVLSVLSVFSTAYIIRALGPEEYGRWATAAALTGATSMLASLGLRPLFISALANAPGEGKRLLANQLALRLALGMLTAVLSVVAAVVLGYSATVVLAATIFGVSMILTTVWTVFGDYLQAAERFKAFAFVNFVAGLSLTGISVIAVWAGGRALALAGAYVVGPFISAVMFGFMVYRRGDLSLPRITLPAARALVRQSKSIALAQLLVSLRDRSEQLVLPTVVGEGMFGLFASSIMPADRLNMLPDALATVLYPRMSRAGESSRHSSVTELIVIIAIVGAAAGAMLFMGAPLIAAILMPSHRDSALAIIRLTALGVPAAGLAIGFTYALQATGSHDTAARVTSAVSVATIATTTIGVCLGGVKGAAIAWVFRQYVLSGALSLPFARRFRRPTMPLLRLSGALIVLIVAVSSLSGSEGGVLAVAGRSSAVLASFLVALAALKVELIPDRG